MQKQIICLMGPTASGKSDLALELVKRFPLEIISVDSAMVYRGLDIGTAKPSTALRAEFPHRLIDIRDPKESYSAGDFQKDALREIKDIFDHGKIPLLVGGTMLYFSALQDGIAQLPKANPEIRAQLTQEAEQFSWNHLHDRLKQIDPVAAQRIHPNDPQRLQRALEVYLITGQTLTELCAPVKNELPNYHFINLALIPSNRKALHQKIADRFDHMLADGFIDEVKKLFNRGDLNPDLPAIRAVGYRQVWEYLNGACSFDEMRERAIAATRQLAKRQLTWLRSWPDLETFDAPDIKTICQAVKNAIS